MTCAVVFCEVCKEARLLEVTVSEAQEQLRNPEERERYLLEALEAAIEQRQ